MPLVTVLLVTYNHGRWIAQALDGVLAQVTDFPFELVVLDDCSTDATRTILATYQRAHPDTIRLRLAERNFCSNAPFAWALEATESPFVAVLDGDDYWTSPDKLRRQVAFLQDHPECSLCFHNVTILHEDGSREPWVRGPDDQKSITTLADILLGNFIPGPSPMLRRHVVPRLPEWFDHCVCGDWPLYITYAEAGAIGYLPADMAVYRVHRGGFWRGQSHVSQLRQLIEFYRYLEGHLDGRWTPLLHRKIDDWQTELATLEPTAGGPVTAARSTDSL